ERLAALGTLAAGTAHELNTPLGTIAILAGELAAQLEGERRAEAEEIRRQVDRCKEIITGMLAPRGGADLEEPKEFEVAPVLEAAVKRWQEGRPGPKPVLDIQPQATRARARLPVHAFERAIANLLDNAAEATENRPAREVRIGLSRSQGELRIQVSDNGIGVPEPLLRRIGEPFFTTKEPGRGTGLGLYLARHVVERQGGEMRVASAEGRGTEVILTVPEAGAAGTPQAPAGRRPDRLRHHRDRGRGDPAGRDQLPEQARRRGRGRGCPARKARAPAGPRGPLAGSPRVGVPEPHPGRLQRQHLRGGAPAEDAPADAPAEAAEAPTQGLTTARISMRIAAAFPCALA